MIKMRKITLLLAPMLFVAGTSLARAQMPQSTIRESTDPARIAEVERRAEALRRGQASETAPSMQPRMGNEMAGPRGHGQAGERHHGRDGHHHGRGGHHHGGRGGMHRDHPKAAPGSGGPAR